MNFDLKAHEAMEEVRDGNAPDGLSHFFVGENKVRWIIQQIRFYPS